MRRTNRLKNRQDFRRVFKFGHSSANRYFVVYVLHKKKDDPVRIGVSVSKRVAKHAVDRNRMKRLVKEVVRQWIGQLPSGLDLVIIARRGSVNLTYKQTKDSLRHLFHRAHLFWEEWKRHACRRFRTHSIISKMGFSVKTADVPLCTDVFFVCVCGDQTAWFDARRLACGETYWQMPPAASGGDWPCTLTRRVAFV